MDLPSQSRSQKQKTGDRKVFLVKLIAAVSPPTAGFLI